jgi:hypothetical protein
MSLLSSFSSFGDISCCGAGFMSRDARCTPKPSLPLFGYTARLIVTYTFVFCFLAVSYFYFNNRKKKTGKGKKNKLGLITPSYTHEKPSIPRTAGVLRVCGGEAAGIASASWCSTASAFFSVPFCVCFRLYSSRGMHRRYNATTRGFTTTWFFLHTHLVYHQWIGGASACTPPPHTHTHTNKRHKVRFLQQQRSP